MKIFFITVIIFYPFFSRMLRSFRPVTVSRLGYHAAVHDHFNNPRNIGTLDKSKVNVGTGMVGAPACGDVMKLMIEVRF